MTDPRIAQMRELEAVATRIAKAPYIQVSAAYALAQEVWGLWWKIKNEIVNEDQVRQEARIAFVKELGEAGNCAPEEEAAILASWKTTP